MKLLSENLRARWAPHGELPTLFLYLEPLSEGAWLPERVGLGEVLIWEKDTAIYAVSFDKITEEGEALVMEGEVEGLWSARLELQLQDSRTGRVRIRRRFTRLGDAVETAIEQSAVIDNGGWWPGNHLILPSFDYNGNPYGKNPYPRPEPIPGFAVRSDRMGQPMVFYQDLSYSYGLAAPEEHPSFPSRPAPPPSLVYSFGVRPSASPLRLSIRYPHEEYAQEGTGPGEVYTRKNEFTKAPVVEFVRLESGESFEDEIYLWVFPQQGLHDYAEMTRFLFARNYPEQASVQQDSLLNQMRLRMDYANHGHYNPQLGPGHYDSHADRPGHTALGFTECSELMAMLSLYQGALDGDSERIRRGIASLDDWIENGRVDGAFRQEYAEDAGYTGNSIFTRRAAEIGERLLAAHEWARRFGIEKPMWQKAALGQVDWLLAHVLPDGAFARQYALGGEVVDDSPCHTAYAIHLLAEAASRSKDSRYLEAARRAWDVYETEILIPEAFYGATLDAYTEDKEAAMAGLDAALAMYRLTSDAKYLDAARIAADHALTYTWAYRMDTFEPESTAAKRAISTFAATTVSPENQHLDTFVDSGLIELGLLLDDPLYLNIGIQSLWWALDGRWATPVPGAGAKQSEQMIQTDWCYLEKWVCKRGEYRDVPENGWTTAHPSYQFLKVGGALVDAALGRGAGIDGCVVASVEREASGLSITLQDTLGRDHEVLLVVRNLPEGEYVVDGAPVSHLALATGYRIPLGAGETRTLTLRG